MKTIQGLLIVALLPLLIGCARTNYQIKQAPLGKQDANLQTIDSMQCYQEAQIPAESLYCGLLLAKACQTIKDNYYEECMNKRGYTVQALD